MARPVVVILPARDERPALGGVLAGIPDAIAGHPVRIVLVDDGSADGTGEVAARDARAIVLRHERPRGPGDALRTGLLHAASLDPVAIAHMDADGQHDARDLPRMVAPILAGQADVVQAVGDPAARAPARRAADVIASLLVRRRIRDSGNGMRAIRPSLAEPLLPLPGTRFAHAQTRVAAHALGLRVLVVESRVAPRRFGSTSTPAGAAFVAGALATLVRRRLAARRRR